MLFRSEQGLVRTIGSGRLPHMRSWPKKYADWADGDPQAIGSLKGFTILSPNGPKYLDESAELRDCLKNNWPLNLHRPIRSLLLSTFTAFRDSTRVTPGGRTEVSHAQFINILDQWLIEYSELEREYTNCPDFKDSRLVSFFLFRLKSLSLTVFRLSLQECRVESTLCKLVVTFIQIDGSTCRTIPWTLCRERIVGFSLSMRLGKPNLGYNVSIIQPCLPRRGKYVQWANLPFWVPFTLFGTSTRPTYGRTIDTVVDYGPRMDRSSGKERHAHAQSGHTGPGSHKSSTRERLSPTARVIPGQHATHYSFADSTLLSYESESATYPRRRPQQS